MVDSMENYKFDLGVKGLRRKCPFFYLSKMINSHLLCSIIVVNFIHNLDFRIVISRSKSAKLISGEDKP